MLGKLTLLQRFAATSLIVFVLIGVGTARGLAAEIQTSALSASESTAFESLQGALIHHLRPGDLQRPMSGRRLKRFGHVVRADVLTSRVVVVKVWNPHGVVVYSTDRSIIGRRFPLEDDVGMALHGHDFADVSSLEAAEDKGQRRFGKLLQVYIPIRFGNGHVLGAFEIYETYRPLADEISALQRFTYAILGGGLFVLYITLFAVVGAGSRTIIRQQKQLERDAQRLENSYAETMMSLAAAVDARDSQTESHSKRVTELAVRLARYVGLDETRLSALRNGAELHDIGKIGVPDALLLKAGSFTEQERERMKRHPIIGYDMIKNVSFLQDALPVVRHHHERWDGQGYPDGLSRTSIPVVARIFCIVDAFDAITSDRPYQRGATTQEALIRIEADAGTHFDPLLAIAFVGMMSRAHVSNSKATGGVATVKTAA